MDCERVTIGRRVPGIFKFQALLSFGLGAWLFYPFPENHADLMNSFAGAATLWLLTAVVFALYLNGRVSYTSEGLYILSPGWRPLIGLAKERFVAFEEITEITPEFPRGGHGTRDWLMFGMLQVHTRPLRKDNAELTLYQAFLNREQLARLLRSLAETRPVIIAEKVINTLAADD